MQKKLVDTGLAVGVSVFTPALHDPALMSFTVQVADNAKPEKILALLKKEIANLSVAVVEKGELSRAKERLLTQVAYERDGVFNEIRSVSEAVAAGDWALDYKLEAAFAKVTVKDVLRVAKTYLQPSQETSGMLLDQK